MARHYLKKFKIFEEITASWATNKSNPPDVHEQWLGMSQ